MVQTKKRTKRTKQQNKALHLYFTELADAFNAAGLDMRAVLAEEVLLDWTPQSVKAYLWRPIQKIMTDIESTADLNTRDITAIYHVLSRHIAQTFGIAIEWPSDDRVAWQSAHGRGKG